MLIVSVVFYQNRRCIVYTLQELVKIRHIRNIAETA